MKEILIITEKSLIESTKHIAKEYDKEDVAEHTIEQVPETFEELKELCKEFGEIEFLLFENNIYFRSMTFHLNGNVEGFEGNIIGENRTPQQMWAIIKNLIGEE